MSSETDADAGEGTDGGYVHVPDEEDGSDAATHTPSEPAPEGDGFGRTGWVLTAVLFTCVLVIPGIIYAYPYVPGVFGFSFFSTYLALPLVPAVLLGLVAVWSMTAATRTE